MLPSAFRGPIGTLHSGIMEWSVVFCWPLFRMFSHILFPLYCQPFEPIYISYFISTDLLKLKLSKYAPECGFSASLWLWRIKTKFINSIVFEWTCRQTIWMEWNAKHENDRNKRQPWINKQSEKCTRKQIKIQIRPIKFWSNFIIHFFFFFFCFVLFVFMFFLLTATIIMLDLLYPSLIQPIIWMTFFFCVLNKPNVQSINELWFFIEVKWLDFPNIPRSKIKIVHFLCTFLLSMLCKQGSCRPTWALLCGTCIILYKYFPIVIYKWLAFSSPIDS